MDISARWAVYFIAVCNAQGNVVRQRRGQAHRLGYSNHSNNSIDILGDQQHQKKDTSPGIGQLKKAFPQAAEVEKTLFIELINTLCCTECL